MKNKPPNGMRDNMGGIRFVNQNCFTLVFYLEWNTWPTHLFSLMWLEVSKLMSWRETIQPPYCWRWWSAFLSLIGYFRTLQFQQTNFESKNGPSKEQWWTGNKVMVGQGSSMHIRSDGWSVWSDPTDKPLLLKLWKKLMLVLIEGCQNT